MHIPNTLVVVSISGRHLLKMLQEPVTDEPNFLNRPTHGLPVHVYYDAWTETKDLLRHPLVDKFIDLDVVQPWCREFVAAYKQRELLYHEAQWHIRLHARQYYAQEMKSGHDPTQTEELTAPNGVAVPRSCVSDAIGTGAHGCNHWSPTCVAPAYRGGNSFLQAYNVSLPQAERLKTLWPGCLDGFTAYKVAAIAHALGMGLPYNLSGAAAVSAGAHASHSGSGSYSGGGHAEAIVFLDSDAYIRAPLDARFWEWSNR